METSPRSSSPGAGSGRLAEAVRWYLGSWAAPEQGWGAVLARLGFVAGVAALDALAGEVAGALGRGESWREGLGSHPGLALGALLGFGCWAALELLPGLRLLDRAGKLRGLARTLAWLGALLVTRWPGWLEAGTVRAVWAGVLLAEAALSFRPAWRWGLYAAACGAGAGWLLAR